MGNDVGTEQRREDDDDQQTKRERGDAVLAEHITGVLEDRGETRGARGDNGFNGGRDAAPPYLPPQALPSGRTRHKECPSSKLTARTVPPWSAQTPAPARRPRRSRLPRPRS